MKEYLPGQETELVNFPQTGLVFKPREIPNEYPTEINERIWLARVRAEIKAIRRKRG